MNWRLGLIYALVFVVVVIIVRMLMRSRGKPPSSGS